ncbi:hypothetical protein [Variovorax sp. E3]|jgi:hypothetical protein|uniref:hypothetical protein n=1 Tax=Variovorax sp. E3 TaxID=1914993 RepID=UPI0018DD6C5F|nr:hypothetical protein [Variovorax sp. E3]
MNLNALARKASKGSAPSARGGAMNVEDMIRFALVHGAGGADEIERLCAQHGWLRNALLEDGTRVVPFALWAQACAAFGRGGVAALRLLLADPELASFAIGVLQEVKTAQSVQVLLGFCASAGWQSPDVTHAEWKALSALNLLLSFDDGVRVEQAVMDDLLRVVITAFDATPEPFLKSLCLWAARGAPTAQALAWLQKLEVPGADVDAARANAIKSVKRRLSPTYKAPDAKTKRQIQRARAADV